MTEQVKNKKKNADTVLLELDPEFSKLKIAFSESFYHHDYRIWLSETPLQDPKLVPFKNVVVNNEIFEFDAVYKKTNTHFSIKLVYPGTVELASFLQHLNEHTLAITKNHTDSISILIEADGCIIRLGNKSENKRAVITYSQKHGNTFLERFPDPSKRFQIQSCSIKDNALTVTCKGPDLYNPASGATSYAYTWKLDIQEEFSAVITSLLQAVFLRYDDSGGNERLL